MLNIESFLMGHEPMIRFGFFVGMLGLMAQCISLSSGRRRCDRGRTEMGIVSCHFPGSLADCGAVHP